MMQLKKKLTIALLISGTSLTSIAPATTDTWLDNDDGTVTDVATGLIWQQQDDSDLRTHPEAIAYCQDLILAGHSNWRLPNIKELTSIVDYRTDVPAIDQVAFRISIASASRSDYWSSHVDQDGNNAWYVDFRFGVVSKGGEDIFFTRCVR